MRAHIRSVPTKETYFKRLGETIDKLGSAEGAIIPDDILNKLSERMQTDEYYERMKEAFGHGSTREDNENAVLDGSNVNTAGSPNHGDIT